MVLGAALLLNRLLSSREDERRVTGASCFNTEGVAVDEGDGRWLNLPFS